MKITGIFIALLLAVSLADVNVLGRFFVDEPLRRGEVSEGYFALNNPTNSEIEDVQIKVYVYELGEMFQTAGVDIQEKDHVMQRVFFPLGERVRPGFYTAKVVVSNDDFRNSRHIRLRVI